MKGVQEGREGRRLRRRRRRRHLVARQDRARGAADRLGRRRERQGLQRVDRQHGLTEGLDDAQPAFVGNAERRRQGRRSPAPPKKVEAVYNYPYQNHATMEPMNATALYTADKCEVWSGTQNGEAAFAATLEASGLPADKCDVHKQMLGGGFGRRGQSDYVRPGGGDRQADAGHAGQAVVVARRGHAARHAITRSRSAS